MSGPGARFTTREGRPLYLQDVYFNQSLFLCLSGPSFAAVDHAQLTRPGIMTMAVNNAPVTYRPQLWVMVDDVKSFVPSIWLDPRITKFVPLEKRRHTLFDNSRWRENETQVCQCPNVAYWSRSSDPFDHERFLDEERFNWGNTKEQTGSAGFRGCRSVMLPAIKIAFVLGFRRIFLLGCDFQMTQGKDVRNYHFEQTRAKGSVRNNNSTYRALQRRFELLRPLLEARNCHVYNCNPDSHLTAFDYISVGDAIAYATRQLAAPEWVATPTGGHWRTQEILRGTVEHKGTSVETGLYDRKDGIKQLKQLHELCPALKRETPKGRIDYFELKETVRKLKKEAKKAEQRKSRGTGRATGDAQSPPCGPRPAGLDLAELRRRVRGGEGAKP